MISRLAAADALIIRPPHAPAVPANGIVPAVRLSALGL